MSDWRIEHDSETLRGHHQWWAVTDGERSFRVPSSEADAKWLQRFLQGFDRLRDDVQALASGLALERSDLSVGKREAYLRVLRMMEEIANVDVKATNGAAR